MARGERENRFTLDAREPARPAQPNHAVVALVDRLDRLALEPFGLAEPAQRPVRAAKHAVLGADPEGAVLRFEQRLHGAGRGRRRFCGLNELLALDAEETRARADPDRAVTRLQQRSDARVVAAQLGGERSHAALLQDEHAGVGADPESLVPVLEQ
jgi:hypothetical protein